MTFIRTSVYILQCDVSSILTVTNENLQILHISDPACYGGMEHHHYGTYFLSI